MGPGNDNNRYVQQRDGKPVELTATLNNPSNNNATPKPAPMRTPTDSHEGPAGSMGVADTGVDLGANGLELGVADRRRRIHPNLVTLHDRHPARAGAVECEVLRAGADVAAGDVVVTADIPLAARAIEIGAMCIDFRGNHFNPNKIGDALASRDLNAYLRSESMEEQIRTEISAKFRRLTIESELVAAGFRPLGWWTDGDFALALARN